MQPPEVSGLLGQIVFAFFLLFFVLGIVGRIVLDRKTNDRYMQEVGNRFSTLFVTMGILGLILFFFSFEQIQLFGARFWYPIWGIAVIVWGYYIVRFMKKEVPALKERSQRLEAQSRYLPTKKKRKR